MKIPVQKCLTISKKFSSNIIVNVLSLNWR